MRLAALRSAFMADVRDVYFFSSLVVRRRGERGGDFDYFVEAERFILTVFDTIFAVLCNDANCDTLSKMDSSDWCLCQTR